MNSSNRTTSNRLLQLKELPKSSRTIDIDNRFMISDNLDNSLAFNMLYENLMSKSMLSMPFKMKFTMMLLCVGGEMKIRYRMNEHTVVRGDMQILIEGSIGECLYISEDAKFIMMAFSNEFQIMDVGVRPTPEILSHFALHPIAKLSDEEVDNVTAIYMMLRSRLLDESFSYVNEFAVCCMRTVFCYISHHFQTNDFEYSVVMSRKQSILDNFLQLVEKHCVYQRKLPFYADKLCISEKYLCRVVSELSGRSPKSWINMRVIMEAKVLLKEGQLSIAQISDRLSFPNQSFFGSFFKKNVGVSPWHYRAKDYE